MLLSDWVDRFLTEERPIGVMLNSTVIEAQAVAAVNFYAGYAVLTAFRAILEPYPAVTLAIDISVSEWAIIRGLFLLYIEREEAKYWESSRGLGVDVAGRSVGEVQGDIANYEMELPRRAFYQDIITVESV